MVVSARVLLYSSDIMRQAVPGINNLLQVIGCMWHASLVLHFYIIGGGIGYRPGTPA